MTDFEKVSEEDSEFIRAIFKAVDGLDEAKRALRDVLDDTASLVFDIEDAKLALLNWWEIEPSALETLLLVFKRAEKSLKTAHKACRRLEALPPRG